MHPCQLQLDHNSSQIAGPFRRNYSGRRADTHDKRHEENPQSVLE